MDHRVGEEGWGGRFSREKGELLSLRERSLCYLCYFLLRLAFVLVFVWSDCVCAWLCSWHVTSRLDRWISDLTVQDALGKIHTCLCLLLLIVWLLFKLLDLRSDGYCVLDFKSYECCLFSLLCSCFLNPWIIWSGGYDEFTWSSIWTFWFI